MAFGRLERTTGPTPMSDINMTPLIDVMLVLLVIFMITAPLMSSSLRLELPKTDAATPSDAPQFLLIGHRGAAARRQGGALRPGGRTDRLGAGRGPEPHRLRGPARRRPGPSAAALRRRLVGRGRNASYNRAR
jgi:hypothetical protein